jgi:hypothetical protein
MAMSFFGTIQRLYKIFAASTEKWKFLTIHVTDFTLKLLSETRWECQLQSVKPIRLRLGQIHDALEEESKSTKDPKIKSEAQSFAENKFYFVWYELLSVIDKEVKVFRVWVRI